MGIKVLHLADIHLGIENYGRPDPKTGLHSRLLDFLESFDQAVDYALANGVELVVFAGDAYKTRDPNPTQQREFASRIKRLGDAGIQVVLLVGNHDVPNSEGKANSLEIFRTLGVQGVHVARRPQVIRLKTRGGQVQVACLPYLTRSSLLAREEFKGLTLEELDKKAAELLGMFIVKLAADLDPEDPAILTAHLSVSNALLGSEKSIMVGKDVILPLSSVALPEFDYVALGHIHRGQILQESGPPVIYAGSIDRVDFGEEKEKKGFYLVDLAKGASSYTFYPVKNRPFTTISLSPKDPEPTEEVLELLGMEDYSRSVVRLNLHLTPEQGAVTRLNEISKFLQREAFFVAGIHKQLSENAPGGRIPGLTEHLGPLDALETYLKLQPGLEDQVGRLMELAQGLVKEIAEEKGL